MRKAIILLDDNSSTSGTVINVIETLDSSAISLKLADKQILWDCRQYAVEEGDIWKNGVFSREGENLPAIPTAEQQIEALQEELNILNTQLTDTQLALCEQYEKNLVLEEELTNTQLALCDVYELIV